MEPLTIAALALGGAKLAGGVVKGIGDYRALRPSEVVTDRINELQRLQEADALGLTGAEKQAYVSAFMNPQRALASEQMAQSQALQAMSQDSGEQLRRIRASEEQAQRAQAEAGRQVQMLDIQKEQAQIDELFQLEMADEQRARAREQALFGMIGGGVQDAGALAGQIVMAEEMLGANKGQYSAAQLQSAAAMYGYQFPVYPTPQQQSFTTMQPGQSMYPSPGYYGPGYGGFSPPNYYGTNLQTGVQVAPGTPTTNTTSGGGQ